MLHKKQAITTEELQSQQLHLQLWTRAEYAVLWQLSFTSGKQNHVSCIVFCKYKITTKFQVDVAIC